MKSIKPRINKEKVGHIISNFVGVALIALSALAIGGIVYAENNHGHGSTSTTFGGTTQTGGSGEGGSAVPTCKEGTNVHHYCYHWSDTTASSNGGFWLKVPAPSDNFSVSELYNGVLRNPGVNLELNDDGKQIRITGCKTGGGYAYIYFTRYYTFSGTGQKVYSGLVGPVTMNYNVHGNERNWNYSTDANGIPIIPQSTLDTYLSNYGMLTSTDSYVYNGTTFGVPLGSSITSMYSDYYTTRAKFMENAEFYAKPQNGGMTWSSKKLGWFCSDAAATTTTTTTTTNITPINCKEKTTMTTYAGETKTRIAVENMTLDGKHVSSDTWGPSTSSYRYSTDYPADSGWTDGDKITYTLAKPGDSVHFLHEICVGDRYVRKATNTNTEYVSAVTDDKRTIVPAFSNHYVEIGANNIITGDDFSFVTNPIPQYNTTHVSPISDYTTPRRAIYNNHITTAKGIFATVTGTGNDITGSTDEYGISVISPSLTSYDFDCNAYGDFISGGYQVPDLAGAYCNSAAKTGVNSVVGQYVSQFHKFSSAKAYEKYKHTTATNCQCATSKTEPVISNMENTSVAGALSSHNGNMNGPTPSCPNQSPTSKTCGTYTYTYGTYAQHYNGVYEYVGTNDWSSACAPGHWHTNSTSVHGPNYCTQWSSATDYGYKIGGSWDSYDYGTPSFPTTFKYDTTVSAGSRQTKIADVFVPYNFETSIAASVSSEDIVYQGTSISTNFSWQILPRANKYTTKNASEKYATSTPADSKVVLIEFLISPTTKKESVNIAGNAKSTKDPCSYYSGTTGCHTIDDSVKGNLNMAGLGGTTGSRNLVSIIPDDKEYIGYKYCVAAGIYPSDSHDFKDTLKTQYSKGNTANSNPDGSAMDGGSYWNISNASCRTVAKKPTFQVWNGSIYTEGKINTSITQKRAGIGYGSTGGDTSGEGEVDEDTSGYSATQTIFGSWADYAVIAGNTVKGFGSGASLGYNNGYHYLKLAKSGLEATSFKQNSSPLTISNDNKDELGKSQINASTSVASVIEKMKARYRDKAASLSASLGTGSSKKLYTTSSALQYVYTNSDLKISEIKKGTVAGASSYNTAVINNSMLVKRFLSDAAISSGNVVDNTLIIYSTGTVTIDKNICYIGASELNKYCEQSYNPTKLSTYKNSKTTAPATLPQILIFANKINITQDVNRIDAWLFSETDVNTCSDFNLNSADSTVGFNPDGSLQFDMITAVKERSKCYRTLMVNGPVFAQNIILNRTAGAHHGYGTDTTNVLNRTVGDNVQDADSKNGSAAPAEIFNLRSDTYIWSRTQAGGNSEAIATYIRELAPRY